MKHFHNQITLLTPTPRNRASHPTGFTLIELMITVAVVAILGAHLLAVVLALKLTGPGMRAAAHLPLTALMVGYTVLGLWLLSTAKGA